MIVFALFIYVIQTVGGSLLLHLIWDSREPKALLLKLFSGIGMGAGVTSSFYFLWSRLGLPGKIYPFFELALLLILVALVWRKESKQRIWAILSDLRRPSGGKLLWFGLLVIAALVCVANFWMLSRAAPHGFYDAWDIWNVGARFVYFSDNHWIEALSQNAWDHADYPLLVTLNVANAWMIIGRNITQAPVAFSLLFMLGLVGLLSSFLVISKDFEQAAFAAILFLSVGELADIGFFQYADLQLAYFLLATSAFIHVYTLERNTRFLFLAGLFTGFAAWTKNEGNVFLAISFLVCIVLSLKEKKNLFKDFGLGLLLPVCVLILFKSVAPPNDLFADPAKSFQQLFDISRYQLLLVQLWQKLINFGFWKISFLLVLAVYTLLMWKRTQPMRGLWIPLTLFFSQFAAYLLIYLITPHDLYWHLNTALDRLMFQIFPILLFWLFTLLPSPRDLFVTKHSTNQTVGGIEYAAHD